MVKLRLKLGDIIKEKGLLQKDVAKETGLRPATISKYANGHVSIYDIKTLEKLMEFFKFDSLDQLIEVVKDDD